MAEPKFEDVAAWLLENPDKEGTTDYVHMTGAFKALDPKRAERAPSAPTKSWGEDMLGRAKLAFGMSPGEHAKAGGAEDVPNLEDLMAAKRLTSDPRSLENRANRVMAQTVGGIPDLGIGLYNAGARTIGSPESQVPYVTPQMNENAGAPELPADAPWYERMGEAGASAFLGGGAGAAASRLGTIRAAAAAPGAVAPTVTGTVARMALPTVVPTVAGDVGGQAGGWVGKALGDEETGALLGSLLGGSAMAVGPATRNLIHSRYAGAGHANAPLILDAANRQGVVPTAGMLGDNTILRREQVLSGQPGSMDVVGQARAAARTGIGNAYDRAADARGSTDYQPTPGTIGHDVAVVAREGVADANLRSSQGQQQLMDTIGARADMNAAPIIQSIQGVRTATDPMTSRPLDPRLAALRQMIRQNRANFDAEGNQIASNIPYERGKDFRTNLRVAGEGYDPVPGRHAETVYDATTDSMRNAAVNQGVNPDVFDTVQGRTARLTGEGGPVETLTPVAEGGETNAYNYLRRGEQQPGQIRSLINTGTPDIGRILGDYMRLIGNDTINKPGARGPINLASRYTRMHPEAREAILGDQIGNVGDTATLSRALDIPTDQLGLTRAIGSQSEGVGRMLVGSETLGKIGNQIAGGPGEWAGRIAGVLGMPAIRGVLANILEGPTARNALARGANPGGIDQLAAALTAIQASQQQTQQQNRAPLQITVHPESRP